MMSEETKNIQSKLANAILDRTASTGGSGEKSYFHHFGEKLVKFSKVQEGAQVLDVGIRTGATLVPLAEMNLRGRIVGIDSNRKIVSKANAAIVQSGIENIELLTMDAERIELPSEVFDFVFCAFTLNFLSNPVAALDEFYRVLKSKGALILAVWEHNDEKWNWTRDFLNEAIESFDDLKMSVQMSGFRLEEIQEEVLDYQYREPKDWMDSLWSRSNRIMDQLSEKELEDFKAQVFPKLESMQKTDGLSQKLQVRFVRAVKL